jgi:hypothetical protein
MELIQRQATSLEGWISEPYGAGGRGRISVSGCQRNQDRPPEASILQLELQGICSSYIFLGTDA